MGSTAQNKPWVLLLAVCIFLFSFSSCFVDVYIGRRPYDYPGTKWVCDDPEIILICPKKGELGYEISGTSMECPDDMVLGFGPGRRMTLHSNSLGDDLFRCERTFSPHKLSAVVTKDDLFEGKYLGRTIVFYRNEANEGQ